LFLLLLLLLLWLLRLFGGPVLLVGSLLLLALVLFIGLLLMLGEEGRHRAEKQERASGAGHSNEFHVVASISTVCFPVSVFTDMCTQMATSGEDGDWLRLGNRLGLMTSEFLNVLQRLGEAGRQAMGLRALEARLGFGGIA